MTFDEIYSMVYTLAQQNSVSLRSVGDICADLHITGNGGGVIGAQIKDGVPTVLRGSIGNPEATISISADDFSAMLTGRLNPMMAVMTGRIKISGNYAKLMSFIKGLRG